MHLIRQVKLLANFRQLILDVHQEDSSELRVLSRLCLVVSDLIVMPISIPVHGVVGPEGAEAAEDAFQRCALKH